MLRVFRAAAVAAMLLMASAAQAGERLTLDQAIGLATGADPAIKAAGAGADAASAGVRQARKLPNPTLGIEAEDFGGTGRVSGTQNAQYTLSYGQTIEVGGDRRARKAIAGGDVDLATARLTIQRLDSIQSVRNAYTEALAAEAAMGLAKERADFARQLAKSVAHRAQSGRDSSMVERQARASVAEAEIDLAQAARRRALTRKQLAALWDGLDDGFVLDRAVFETLSSKDDAPTLDGHYPDLALNEAAQKRAAGNVSLEKARAVPDPTISGGVRRYGDGNETAFVVGLSIPIPVFDSNRDNIAKAQSERLQSELEATSARRILDRQLADFEEKRDSARVEVEKLRASAIPEAAQALRLARDGYDKGAFSYLQIADARRGLNGVRSRLVEALKTYHESQAAIDRLTGHTAGLRSREEVRP